MKRTNKLLSFVLLILIGISTVTAQDIDKQKWESGKKLFKANCASCHHPTEKRTGPALSGAVKRWEEGAEHAGKSGKDWLRSWVKNWNDPVGAGNPYAVKMVAFDASAMNTFTNLSDEQIDDIFLYADNSNFGAGDKPKDSVKEGEGADVKKEEGNSKWVIFGIIFIVLGLIYALTTVNRSLEKLVAHKNGEEYVHVPFYKNKKWQIVFGLIAAIVLFYLVADQAISIGRQQGYQPDQPIKFSHKTHAGTHKIDCQYCHSSANDGKHSNIPSVSTCMNCHKVIQSGKQFGKTEIAKIYEYADYNPETKVYGNNPKPIEWIRIHNMPDHVYFNHAQHVNVGKVECQTCHGPVEEMEKVYQHAPLSMGWCINCHRNTEVKFGENEYYKSYESLHAKLKNKTLDKVTVETIGGTECQKCHY